MGAIVALPTVLLLTHIHVWSTRVDFLQGIVDFV